MVTGVAMLLGLCAVSIQLLMRLNADVQGRYGAAVALERLGASASRRRSRERDRRD